MLASPHSIYSGTLDAGSYVLNSTKGKKERVGRMVEMHANSREDIKEAVAGDIIAIAGLKVGSRQRMARAGKLRGRVSDGLQLVSSCHRT